MPTLVPNRIPSPTDGLYHSYPSTGRRRGDHRHSHHPPVPPPGSAHEAGSVRLDALNGSEVKFVGHFGRLVGPEAEDDLIQDCLVHHLDARLGGKPLGDAAGEAAMASTIEAMPWRPRWRIIAHVGKPRARLDSSGT